MSAYILQVQIVIGNILSNFLIKGFILNQYFGVTLLHQGAGQAGLLPWSKEGWDFLCHAIAFNIKRLYLTGVRKPVGVPAT